MSGLKPLEVAKRQALALGGELVVGDKKFNTSRVESSAIPKKTVPTPPPEVKPSESERTLKAIKDLTLVQGQIIQTIRANSQTKPSVKTWRFKIIRNAKGDLTDIVATGE